MSKLSDILKKRAQKQHQIPSEEEVEIALAWANGDITLAEAATVFKKQYTSTYIVLARSLREYIRRNK